MVQIPSAGMSQIYIPSCMQLSVPDSCISSIKVHMIERLQLEKEKAVILFGITAFSGTPEGIRTPDLLVRSAFGINETQFQRPKSVPFGLVLGLWDATVGRMMFWFADVMDGTWTVKNPRWAASIISPIYTKKTHSTNCVRLP